MESVVGNEYEVFDEAHDEVFATTAFVSPEFVTSCVRGFGCLWQTAVIITCEAVIAWLVGIQIITNLSAARSYKAHNLQIFLIIHTAWWVRQI